MVFDYHFCGLGALKLSGFRDATMYPACGQVVVVRDEFDSMMIASGTEDAPSEDMYAMVHAAGGRTILAGTFEVGNWES